MDKDRLKEWLENKKRRRNQLTVETIHNGIITGDLRSLSDGGYA